MSESDRKTVIVNFVAKENVGCTVEINGCDENPMKTKLRSGFSSELSSTKPKRTSAIRTSSKTQSVSKKNPNRSTKTTGRQSVRRKLIKDEPPNTNPKVVVSTVDKENSNHRKMVDDLDSEEDIFRSPKSEKKVSCLVETPKTRSVKKERPSLKRTSASKKLIFSNENTSAQKNDKCKVNQIRKNQESDDEWTPTKSAKKIKLENSRRVKESETFSIQEEDENFETSELIHKKARKNISSNSYNEKNFSTPKSKRFSTPERLKLTPRSSPYVTPKSSSRKIERSVETPSSETCEFDTKTPYRLRKKVVQKIRYEKNRDEDDFSSEISELEDSEEEWKDLSEEESVNENLPDFSTPSSKKEKIVKKIDKLVTLNADHYFDKKITKKICSDNTLSDLAIPSVSSDEINDAVASNYVKHSVQVENLCLRYSDYFLKWMFYLKEGFNLLMYGLGSKQQILNKFQEEALNGNYVVTVNGFYPGFAIAELFTVLMKDTFHEQCSVNINETISNLRYCLEKEERPVFIIIHNIDGIALRGSKQQKLLCKLAELPYIHIIASADHINAPLLWGNNKMSSLKFLWLDVTTFNPYTTETSFENSLEIEHLGTDSSLMSLNSVFKSVQPKSKQIFKLFAKNYLENKNKKDFKGVLIVDLCRWAKDEMLIQSNFVLNKHLMRFVDHGIISMKHNYVISLISANVLSTFYKQHFNDDDD